MKGLSNAAASVALALLMSGAAFGEGTYGAVSETNRQLADQRRQLDQQKLSNDQLKLEIERKRLQGELQALAKESMKAADKAPAYASPAAPHRPKAQAPAPQTPQAAFAQKEVEQWINEIRSQVFLIEIAGVANNYTGAFLMDGAIAYAGKDDVIGDSWRISSINHNGAVLMPTANNKQKSPVRLQLRSYSQAQAALAQIDKLREKMMDAQVSAITSGNMMPFGPSMSGMPSDGPMPGVMFE